MQMLGTSGFKWNDEKHTIVVEKSVYDEYSKIHPNCRNLYGVPLPYLDEMESIYGKDYATGKAVKGFVEAVENLEKEAIVSLSLESSDDDVAADGSSAPSLKKFENFADNMNVHLSAMANAMKRAEDQETELHDREIELAKMSDKVLDELLALKGITTDEALVAVEVLLAQPHKLALFFKCSSALRMRYVKGLLGESQGGRP
ncbi:hypothetical protein DM860_001761 [Cuscuta australis]|uniref:Myb/SANT-like domain-containing protein n=1 Tax=Cuscuta australis TaxID=267555 RepID=A0A328EDI2_9ASTE|nr:hypothetical protein DM860_001761 [Cuscuta australis]